MVDNKTEKIKEKTAEGYHAAADGVNKAEEKMESGVDAVEHSKIGKTLPTHIEKVEFKDIVFGTLFMVAVLFIPVYLMLSTDMSNPKTRFEFIKKCIYWILFATGFIGVIFDAVVVMMKKHALLKVVMILKTAKDICVILLAFMLDVNGALARGLLIVYLTGVIIVDALFVYYTVIFFKRIESNEFDDKGNRLKAEQQV